MKLASKYSHTLKALGITILAVAMSYLMVAPFSSSLSALFSQSERGDFITPDLFAQVADGRPVRSHDERVVLVDIGHGNRYDIAEALEIISLCGPKAVGVDVNFARPGDDDTPLLEALDHNPGIVVPMGLGETTDGKLYAEDLPFFDGMLPDVRYGVVNLQGNKEVSTIREFTPLFDVSGKEVPSFPMALLREGDPNLAAQVEARGNKSETISYPSREYTVIPLDAVADYAETLADKYVLVGSMIEADDMHATPINSYMAGLKIHAYTLSTMLDGAWYTHVPGWVEYAIAILICYMMIYANISIKSKMRGMLLRIVQVLILYVMVRVGYALYVDHNTIVNFSFALLMITFGFFAVDVWNGAEATVEFAVRKIRNIINRQNRTECERSY